MSKLQQAGEILSSYVSHGALQSDDQFDAHFQDLEKLVPAAHRQTPAAAWCVIVVLEEDHQCLLKGDPLVLRQRTFGSWTKDEHAARLLLRGRCAKAAGGSISLIVRKDLDPGSCIVDVKSLYRALGWDHPDVEEWGRYASWEKEIILRQTERLCTVAPEDVVVAHTPGDPAAVRPFEGEEAWLSDVERFEEIVEVLDEQAHLDQGIWLVVFGDDEEHAIAWDPRHSCWKKTEIPEMSARMAL